MRIGALVIGQTPRPDLETVLGVPADFVRGALDLPGALPVPPPGDEPVFPLRTRLSDGRIVVVDEPHLSPRLQQHIDDLEREGASVIALLCAGPFRSLRSSVPLLHPFRLAVAALENMGLHRLLVLVPIEAQRQPAEVKWRGAGFAVDVWVFPPQVEDLAEFIQRHAGLAQAVVFDYVGMPETALDAVRKSIAVPVIDLGHLMAGVLRSLTDPPEAP
ncbi:MAG: protein AroM [Rhodothermales bacterium]|jgi:protein AroM